MTTHTCAECGTRAEPGQSFCDACGAVLSWKAPAPPSPGHAASGHAAPGHAAPGHAAPGHAAPGHASTGPASTGPAPAGPDEAHAPAARATALAANPASTGDESTARAGDRARADVSAPPAARADAPAPGRPTAPPAPAPSAAPYGPEGYRPAAYEETAPTVPVRAPLPDDTMTGRARNLLVPVADREDRPAEFPQVAPVLPGRPVADRPQVRAPGHDAGELNGLPCPWCATPNRPDRHYCSRCAMPMTRAEQSAERLPWWRRLTDSRRRENPWAGDRPRLRRTFDSVLRWVGAALVLALLVVLGMNTSSAVNGTRDHFAKRAPVAPDEFSASRSFSGHKPALAFDKLSNTWWGPGVSESGGGEWIEARFTEPARLLDLVITPGVSTRANRIGESALPHRLKATVTTKDGKVTTRNLTLDQGAGAQRRAFRVGDAVKVRFTVQSAYGASASKQVALAEVEFFGPSSANSG